MRDVGFARAVFVGLWCDSPSWTKIFICVGGVGHGAWYERFVCSTELRPCARVDLVELAGDFGPHLRLCGGSALFTVVGAYRMDILVAGLVGAAKRAQSIAGKCVFRPNFADVGARAICPVSWLGAMAGLVMALRRADVGAGAFVA